MLHFDGPNGGTIFKDDSPHHHGNATVLGNAQVDTSQSVFGTGSGLFDGSGDVLTYPGISPFDGSLLEDDWNFTNQPFTIECRIRPANTDPGVRFIVAKWLTSIGGNLSWVLWHNGATLNWNVSTTGSNSINVVSASVLSAPTSSPDNDGWIAVCVDYDGIKTRLYADGVMVASNSTSYNIHETGLLLSIGANQGNAFYFNGNIDELRISKGIARYASDSGYTLANAPFPSA